MNKSLLILGSQPALSIAEIESLYGPEKMSLLGKKAVILDIASNEINFLRLGGSIRLGNILTEFDTISWHKITQHLLKLTAELIPNLPAGKIKFAISTFDIPIKPQQINATGLSIKKIAKNMGRSIRIVPNKDTALNSAQVLNNKLTEQLGVELLLVHHGNKTIVAKTIRVQNINAYANRDHKRPYRDARVGMLPPKLAQIIINLAQAQHGDRLLDPFCGTGVVMQEALLMGCFIIGTDIESRMIDYTQKNLFWLFGQTNFNLIVGDACEYKWPDFDVVASETYLGRPFSAEPNPDKLHEVMQNVDTIHRKFLLNLARQTKPGLRICLAVPAWHTKYGIKHLKYIDNLGDLGYNRMSFKHINNADLIYHREGQIVGRELIILIRK